MAQLTSTRTISDSKLKRVVRQIVRDELAKAGKTKRLPSRARLTKRDENLRRHFSAVDLGHATGAGNKAIDADLARAFDPSRAQTG